MKFLVDAQLPPDLCDWLHSQSYEARHVLELDHNISLPDSRIWEIAKNEGEIILSKDRDFYDRALISEGPPQVLHLALGNCSNRNLLDRLSREWSAIIKMLMHGATLISVTKTQIYIFD